MINALRSWIPPWAQAARPITEAVGKVTCQSRTRGSCTLLGIDRVILPYHTVKGSSITDLHIYFSKHDYAVQDFLLFDPQLDVCVLKLCPKNGRYPGCDIAIPKIADKVFHQGRFSMAFFSKDAPESKISANGESCFSGHFCSTIFSEHGVSGAALFDKDGYFFAMHIAQSSGNCCDPMIRKALYISEVIKKYPQLFLNPVCTPIPLLHRHRIIPWIQTETDPCFVDQGGRPAFTIKYQTAKRTYTGWEWYPTNNVSKGPRGITIVAKGIAKTTYKFDINPHGIGKYNSNKRTLYDRATRALILAIEEKGFLPDSFTFKAYSIDFEGTRD